MEKKPRVLVALNQHWYPTILSPLDRARLEKLAKVIEVNAPPQADKSFLLKNIGEADIAITSWDTAQFDADIIKTAQNLKLVCHAAGSVRPVVSDALWQKKIQVTSAAAAISYGVAEYCLGLALMATKRVFWLAQGVREGYWMEPSSCFGGLFELYQQNVGVIGAGNIGRRLVQLLFNFDCNIFLYDPFCSAADATAIGAKKAETLDELFSTCRMVSLNAPTNEATRHMLRGSHFAALQKGSVFINTAGNMQIHEEEFIQQLRRGHFVACIDRCAEEPCALDHPFRTLPNVILTPHIAGVAAENRLRIGTYAVDEIEAFINEKPLNYEITEEKLQTIA